MLASKNTYSHLRAQAGPAGRRASEVMTPEQKKERARLGGIAAARSMTPEQRSERARKGAMTLKMKRQAVNQ